MKTSGVALSFAQLGDLVRRAEAGGGDALVDLARAVRTGFTVQADVDESHALLLRAETFDCASAHMELGDFYADRHNIGYFSVQLAFECYGRARDGGRDVEQKLAMLFMRNEFREIASAGGVILRDAQWQHFLRALRALEESTSCTSLALLPYYRKNGAHKIDALLDRLVEAGDAKAMVKKGHGLLRSSLRNGRAEALKALRLFRRGACLGNKEAFAGIYAVWQKYEDIVDTTTAMYALRTASLSGFAQDELVHYVAKGLGLTDMAAEYARVYGVGSRWLEEFEGSVAQEVVQDIKFSQEFAHLQLARIDRESDNIFEDLDTAFTELVPLSITNPNATNDVALMYLLGFGVTRNRMKAVKMLKEASLKGGKLAEYNYLLTQFGEWGSSTGICYSRVREFMKEVEELWPAESLYYRGIVESKDYVVAKNADRGDAEEAGIFAITCSISYFVTAASKGHVGANLRLAELYSEVNFFDAAKSIYYYEEAAKLGSFSGMVKLANDKIGRYTLKPYDSWCDIVNVFDNGLDPFNLWDGCNATQSVFIEAQAGDFSGSVDGGRSAVLDVARQLLDSAHAGGFSGASDGLLYLLMVQGCGKISLHDLARVAESGNRLAQYELARNLELMDDCDNHRIAMHWYRECRRNGYDFDMLGTLSKQGMERLMKAARVGSTTAEKKVSPFRRP